MPTFESTAALHGAMPDIETVTICAPPRQKGGLVKEALLAGKHVVAEHPLTTSLSRTAEICLLAEKQDRSLFLTSLSRYSEPFSRTKAFLSAHGVRHFEVEWRGEPDFTSNAVLGHGMGEGLASCSTGIDAWSVLTHVMPDRFFVSRSDLEYPYGERGPIQVTVRFKAPVGDAPAPSAIFDWSAEHKSARRLTFTTKDDRQVELDLMSQRLAVDGKIACTISSSDHAGACAQFARSIDEGRSNADPMPFTLLSDLFFIGGRQTFGR